MQYARTYKTAVFYLIFTIVAPGAVWAAAITNLDFKTHDLLADGREVSIKAGETWRVPGKVKINYHGRDINLEETDEYAIWNDHDFGPQKHTQPGAGNLGQ